MAAFLLVTTGRTDGAMPVTPAEVFEKLMLLLLSEGFWPHAVQDPSGRLLEPGDSVRFCLVGEDGAQVVGDARVAARSTPLTPPHLAHVHMYVGHLLPSEPGALSHAVALAAVNIWDDARPCTEADAPTPDLLAAAHTGAVLPAGLPEPMETSPPELPASPPHGCEAQAFILANWELVDFGEPLRPVEDTGIGAIATPAGPIDLICEGADSEDVVAVMWANGEPPDELLAAVRERLAWLRRNVGQDGRRVRGLILTLDGRHDDIALADGDLDVRRLRILCEPVRPLKTYEPDPLAIVTNFAAPAIIASESPEPSGDLDFAAKCLRVPRTKA